MGTVVVATQEKAVKVTALLQLKQGRNRSMWMKLPDVEVAVVGMGYDLVVPDLTIKGAKRGARNTEFGNNWFNIVVVCFAPPKSCWKETED